MSKSSLVQVRKLQIQSFPDRLARVLPTTNFYSTRTVVMYPCRLGGTLRHQKTQNMTTVKISVDISSLFKAPDPQGWLDQQTKFRLEKLVYPCISVYAKQQPPRMGIFQISHGIFRFAPGHYLSHHDVQVPVIIRSSLAIQKANTSLKESATHVPGKSSQGNLVN